MHKNKKARIGPGMIKGAIISLIFLTILVSMLPSLIETSATAVHNLSDEYDDTALYGTQASAIGVQIDDWTGYFWVIGPFILVISIITGLFMTKRRRG